MVITSTGILLEQRSPSAGLRCVLLALFPGQKAGSIPSPSGWRFVLFPGHRLCWSVPSISLEGARCTSSSRLRWCQYAMSNSACILLLLCLVLGYLFATHLVSSYMNSRSLNVYSHIFFSHRTSVVCSGSSVIIFCMDSSK